MLTPFGCRAAPFGAPAIEFGKLRLCHKDPHHLSFNRLWAPPLSIGVCHIQLRKDKWFPFVSVLLLVKSLNNTHKIRNKNGRLTVFINVI